MMGVRIHGARNLTFEQLAEPRVPGTAEVLIRVDAAGICGSDLHMYLDARIGDTGVKGPMVLGHEFSGTILSAGPSAINEIGVTLAAGMRVAVDPAQPCGVCELCKRGHPNLCTNLHFCGLFPDGGCFCERMVVPARTCFQVPDSIDAEEAALLEPLGIALHAVSLAHVEQGESAVIIGAGPIGLLILEVAKYAGLNPIFVVEQLPWRLQQAEKLGGIPIDSARTNAKEKLMVQTLGRGVDVVFEAAWADQTIQLGAEMVRYGGKVVLVGIPRDDKLILSHSTARRKGLTIWLSRRMKHTYPKAIELVENKIIDVKGIVTHRFPLSETPEAFAMNADYRDHVIKAMITYP